jgi:serine protease AprX
MSNIKSHMSAHTNVIITTKSVDAAKKLSVNATHRYNHLPSVAATLSKSQIYQLVKNPNVVRIEYDEPVKATAAKLANYYYGTENARADYGVDGKGVTIAVVDTGIDASHVDLKGKVIGWNDLVNNKPTPYDDHGHGTHVSSIAAGMGIGNPDYKGVAPGASLVGVKVLDANGSGSTSTIMDGIDWVIANKDKYNIRVMNMSLGSAGSSDGTDADSMAVNKAFEAGIVPAIAAGNSGPSTKTIGAPAAATNSLAVGAMADPSQGGFDLAYFSSRGTTADGRIKPDIMAPGWKITAAKANSGNGYITYSGTSMATPFVAGTAALMIEANPKITPSEVAADMEHTATDWGTPGKDIDYGWGNLNGYKAIKLAGGFTGGNGGPIIPRHTYTEGSISTIFGKKEYIYSLKAGETIAVSMIIDPFNYIPDFDLYLVDPSGKTVEYSTAYLKRQETLSYKAPVSGDYTVSVQSYIGTGGFFFDTSIG